MYNPIVTNYQNTEIARFFETLLNKKRTFLFDSCKGGVGELKSIYGLNVQAKIRSLVSHAWKAKFH